MPEDLSISSSNDLRPFEDYNFLRAEGIKLIEKLSGKVWTDYNAHDPGITLLEALCYTLTDLGYRTSFEIKDVLTPDSEQAGWNNVFYTSRQILPTNPVTILDYRKLVIDTEGVKNAWIEISNDYEQLLYLNEQRTAGGTGPKSYQLAYSSPADNEPLRVKGLYKVTIEYDEDIMAENKQQLVDAVVRKKLNIHRNLCEDFLTIQPVDYELFVMKAEIQANEGFDIERISARIFQVIHNFFSPSIKFYTLDQMMKKGYSAEEIFDGPALKYGFIDSNELETSEKYTDIHLSDIISLITKIPGVIAVKECVFPIETQSAFSDFTQWITKIKEKEKMPRLDIENSIITFTRSGDRYRSETEKKPDKKKVMDTYLFLQSEIRTSKLKGAVNDIAAPAGEFMNIAEYYPFQYTLPSCYGMQEKVFDQNIDISIIEKTVTQTALNIRSRQILQLRGFLMVFEQVMADYLSQLANIRQLFSFDTSIEQTYFPQHLQGIYDMKLLFIDIRKYHDNIVKLIETNKIFLKRRNMILNHLMARFGEDSEAYATPIPIHNFKKNNPKTDIRNKCDLLSDYISISNYRGNGFDYSNTDQVWNTDNVPGMKKRICRLLGITNYETAFITSDWISIDKIVREGNVPWLKVVLKDPDKPLNILLESKEYETESETLETLKYILQSGFDQDLYHKDETPGKYSYNFKRANQDGGSEIVAFHNVTNKEELDNSFKKTIETLDNFAHTENFHVLEHILLRPKVNPQETGSSQGGAAQLKATELLSVTNIPDQDFVVRQKQALTSYYFKTRAEKDPNANNRTVWKLSLRREKDRTDVLVSDDDFIFDSHIRKREEHIRQVATDYSNYEQVNEKEKDDRWWFKILDPSKKPVMTLARSSRTYEKQQDIEEEIQSLIKFFSFEFGFIDDQETDSIDFNSFADPYSFRISLFIPSWPLRFRDPGFRHLFEKAIYMETPSHVYPDVYWLDYKEMKEFETVYKLWLAEISTNEIPSTTIVNNLINVLNQLRGSDNNA